jgi:TetR/AcrR family transcriptional regulator, transcriptional repressor for nem operon
MDGQNTTRACLISEGMRQLLAFGYEGVGIGPILKAVDVPKGSFYYFFQSKDDFVVAVIEAYEQKYRRIREVHFSDEAKTPLARLDAYFAALEHELKEDMPFAGCLYGVIAQTAAGRSALVRDAVITSLSRWEKSISNLLSVAQENGEIAQGEDIGDLTASVVEAYEGALIRVRAMDDISAFTRFRTKGLRRLFPKVAAYDCSSSL